MNDPQVERSKQKHQSELRKYEKNVTDHVTEQYKEIAINQQQELPYTINSSNKASSGNSHKDSTQIKYLQDKSDSKFINDLEEIHQWLGRLQTISEAKNLSKANKQFTQELIDDLATKCQDLQKRYKANKLPTFKIQGDEPVNTRELIKKLTTIMSEDLEKANFCNKGKINKNIENQLKLLQTYKMFFDTVSGLQPRAIEIQDGHMIIEKNVPVPPDREEIEKIIHDFMSRFPVPKPEVVVKEVPIHPPKVKKSDAQNQTVPMQMPQQQPQIQQIEVPKIIKQEDQLGKAYQLLYGQRNYFEALKLLESLDAKGDYNATCTLGQMYMDGNGVTKDVSKATQYFLKAMKGGQTEAVYRLAILLEKGLYKEFEDRQQNIRRAVELYEKASNEGHSDASTDLAYILENGLFNVRKDIKKAWEKLLRAKEKRNPRALNNLGIMYFKNVIKDNRGNHAERAFECFREAANQGYVKAYTSLGICYETGRGAPKNLDKALEYFKLSSESGDPDGLYHLAYFTMEEAGRDDNNQAKYEEAVDLFREVKFKDPKNGDAYYYLGFFYESGFGVERDMETALNYYSKAASLNVAKAWSKVGNFYTDGKGGVEMDTNQALHCYLEACKLGDDEAMNQLGVMYEEGIGVIADAQKAFDYYQQSADLGNAKAKLNIGHMMESGKLGQKNAEDAMKRYEEAADEGCTTAQMLLSFRQKDENIQNLLHSYIDHVMENGDTKETLDMSERDNMVDPKGINFSISNLNENEGKVKKLNTFKNIQATTSLLYKPNDLKSPPGGMKTSQNKSSNKIPSLADSK